MQAADAASSARRSDWIVRVHLGLSAVAALLWALFLMELLGTVPAPLAGLADLGVPLGSLALFLLLPIALPALWWLDRRSAVQAGRRALLVVSRLFLGLTWLPTCLLALFWVAVFQPWPLTMLEGPGTDFARAGFERICGVPPPPGVSGVYYRVDGPRDPTFFLRCEGVEPELLLSVVDRLHLSAAEGRASPIGEGRVPPWWPEEEERAFDRSFLSVDGRVALTYRERGGLLLYRETNF
jgi:hypothetical protein